MILASGGIESRQGAAPAEEVTFAFRFGPRVTDSWKTCYSRGVLLEYSWACGKQPISRKRIAQRKDAEHSAGPCHHVAAPKLRFLLSRDEIKL